MFSSKTLELSILNAITHLTCCGDSLVADAVHHFQMLLYV